MRNKLGIVQIKVRAKNPATLDLSDVSTVSIDDIIITGNIKDAIGGKLVALDFCLIDETNDVYVYYYGVTLLNVLGEISVIGFNSDVTLGCLIELNDTAISITSM